MTREEIQEPKQVENYDSLGTVQKLKLIETVLNEKIRQFLQADGGDLTIIEMKDDTLYIRYIGACHGCGGADGTLMAVQNILRENISDKIIVQSV